MYDMFNFYWRSLWFLYLRMNHTSLKVWKRQTLHSHWATAPGLVLKRVSRLIPTAGWREIFLINPRTGARAAGPCDSQVLYQVMLKAQSQAPSCDKSSRGNLSYWQKLQATSFKPQATSLKLQAIPSQFPDPWTTVHGYWKSFWCSRTEGLGYDKCVVWMFHMERNLMRRKF